jgi:hypothetical protein
MVDGLPEASQLPVSLMLEKTGLLIPVLKMKWTAFGINAPFS